MLKKIAVLTALAAFSACGGGGGSDKESIEDRDARAGGESDAAQPHDGEATKPDAAGQDAAVQPQQDAASEAGSGGADAASDAGALDASALDAGDAASDASSTDASGDGSAPDASVPMFTLSVRRGKSALAQAPVFFHAESGALLAEHATGADGRLVSTSVPSMLTVIVPRAGNVTATIQDPQLFTITQVAAGDEIVLELPAEAPTPAPAPLPGYSVSIPGSAPDNTTLAVAYGGELSCANKLSQPFSSPIALAWPQDCAVQSANTLLAVAYRQVSASRIDAIGFAFAKGVPAFGASPQAVTLGAWTAPGTTQVGIQNVPTNADVEGKLLLYSEGASFDPTGILVSKFPKPGTTRTLSIPTPVGLATEQALMVNISGIGNQLASLATRSAPAAKQTLDMASGLPGATSGTLNRATPARAVASWTNATTPANQADGTVVFLEYGAEPAVTPWLLITPATANTVTLPELPESRRAFASAAPAHWYVSHFGSSKQQGYRDFLKEPLRPTLVNSYHPLARTLTSETSLQAISFVAQ